MLLSLSTGICHFFLLLECYSRYYSPIWVINSFENVYFKWKHLSVGCLFFKEFAEDSTASYMTSCIFHFLFAWIEENLHRKVHQALSICFGVYLFQTECTCLLVCRCFDISTSHCMTSYVYFMYVWIEQNNLRTSPGPPLWLYLVSVTMYCTLCYVIMTIIIIIIMTTIKVMLSKTNQVKEKK